MGGDKIQPEQKSNFLVIEFAVNMLLVIRRMIFCEDQTTVGRVRNLKEINHRIVEFYSERTFLTGSTSKADLFD
jgi:hypothetical protein